MTNASNESNAARINEVIAGFADQLADVDDALAIDSAGVAQAVDALRKALDKVEHCLKEWQYEEVANLGYRDVSSEFIFLQRTMGALLSQAHERSAIVSEIAMQANVAYEEADPLVARWCQCRSSRGS